MTVGFALVCTVAPIVGKRVFLRVVSTISTVMHGITTAAATVKKAAFGRSKSPAFAGTKNSCLLDASLRLSPGDFCFPLFMRIGRCGCRCRPAGIALGHHSASHGLGYGHDACHAVLGYFVQYCGCCRAFADCHPDTRNHHCWLVSFDTWARAYCHVSSCLMIRGLVSNDTRWQCGFGRARV